MRDDESIVTNKEALEALDADRLREMARQAGHTGSHIAFAKKTTLVNLLLGNPVGAERKACGNVRKDELADILAAALSGRIRTGLDEDRVRRIVADEVERLSLSTPDPLTEDRIHDLTQTILGSLLRDAGYREQIESLIGLALASHRKAIDVVLPDGSRRDVGLQHREFEKVMKLVSLRMDVFLVGPAGSGKTTLCESVAKALGLPFYVQPVGLQTTKSDLLGFLNAQGVYVPSLLRRAYEQGGVFLMDEIDAGNANVLTVINAMLSNGTAGFPDGMVSRHPDFVFIAAGNTYGRGSDRQYVGRNPIDAATLDRFAIVEFDYDEAFETALSVDPQWTGKVQKIRRIVEELKERVIVSPRASIKGGILLKAGFTEKQCLEMLIFKGVNREVRERIEANL